MESVDPKSYAYKTDPDTPRVGLTTRDLKKTPEGAAAVSRGPDGLERVDTGQAAMMAMAGTADLHKRVKALEAAKGGPPKTVGLERERGPSPQDEAARLLASPDPREQARGRMMSLGLAQREDPRTEETLAQLGREQQAERQAAPFQRDVMTPAEIYASDLRKFRLRQVRDGAEAMRPRPKPARDPVAQQIATTRGVPYSDVLAALGRTA
jgi:hypothetical protein